MVNSIDPIFDPILNLVQILIKYQNNIYFVTVQCPVVQYKSPVVQYKNRGSVCCYGDLEVHSDIWATLTLILLSRPYYHDQTFNLKQNVICQTANGPDIHVMNVITSSFISSNSCSFHMCISIRRFYVLIPQCHTHCSHRRFCTV